MQSGVLVNSLFSLNGKVALVTGGSQGIGMMIARGLLQAGAKVYICSRKQAACEAAAAELSGYGQCVTLVADVSARAGIDSLAAQLAAREPALHILVNNAGATWGAPLESYPDEAWDRVLGLNVKSVFLLTQALIPMLTRAASPEDPARNINIGSINGLRPPAMENYAYSASKAAVHHLTRVLAQRLARKQITVNAVAPGPFPSKRMNATLQAHGDEYRSQCPLGRLGEPDDMAGISVFLSARASSYLTGQVIAVDGGLSTTP